MLKIWQAGDPAVKKFLTKTHNKNQDLLKNVEEIVEAVRLNGEEAVFAYTRKFDGATLNLDSWKVKTEEIQAAYKQVDVDFLRAIKKAYAKIVAFHEKQKQKSWWEMDENGSILGQIYRPLARVGIYVPGGTAAYPSSVLMTAVPAVVAGVKEIIMTSPPAFDGSLNPYTLVAADLAGVTEIYKVGGAQAIAALAYGTENLKPVDKIVGPGNIYVTLAKKLVYGQVDIDMLAGPSEILIVADETAKADYIAADLLSQAEHDPLASAILLTTSDTLANDVKQEVTKQLNSLPRAAIARKAIEQGGCAIIVKDLEEAIGLANDFAPEHLELAVDAPFDVLGQVQNAGAIFLGHYSPESLGDYYAGPNHVLPTGGTARFYSPLNVDMYMKKSSLISYSKKGLEQVGQDIIKLAQVEGLEAHAKAIEVRMESR
ncbi:MAG: histidinol dehydrogenase [Zhaonellaceae bacterium]|jgi:histidinol dehydrogenase|nr:histidinol dehydrogenase [Clostridia bacterium]